MPAWLCHISAASKTRKNTLIAGSPIIVSGGKIYKWLIGNLSRREEITSHSSLSWSNGVVPLWTGGVVLNIQGLHFFVCNLNPDYILFLIEHCADG